MRGSGFGLLLEAVSAFARAEGENAGEVAAAAAPELEALAELVGADAVVVNDRGNLARPLSVALRGS